MLITNRNNVQCKKIQRKSRIRHERKKHEVVFIYIKIFSYLIANDVLSLGTIIQDVFYVLKNVHCNSENVISLIPVTGPNYIQIYH